MISPNRQYLIAQELSKLGPSVKQEFSKLRPMAKLVDYEITGYETDDDYRLAISTNIGMFTESFIKSVIKLSQQYGFSWFVSDTCLAVPDNKLFIIIY